MENKSQHESSLEFTLGSILCLWVITFIVEDEKGSGWLFVKRQGYRLGSPFRLLIASKYIVLIDRKLV